MESDDPSPNPNPKRLSIDLNQDPCDLALIPPSASAASSSDHETPSTSTSTDHFLPYEAYILACRFHAAITPSRGLPARFPGEAGFNMPPLPCAYCTRPELPGATMVCDACDRGFHLGCAVSPSLWHQRIDEWVCPDCQSSGVPARKWNLAAGGTNPILLDINAPPPTEPDADAEPQDDGISLLSTCNRPSNPDISPLSGFATSLQHFAINNPQIFTESSNRGSFYFQGPSPDGRHFMPAFNSGPGSMSLPIEVDSLNDNLVPPRSAPVRRRRVRSNIFTSSYLAQNQEILRGASSGSGSRGLGAMGPFMDLEAMQPRFADSAAPPRLPRYLIEENGRYTQMDFPAGFPIQFEDYYLVNLGEVDFRMTYHTSCEIFPVGFVSYWHDRVTGSLFEFEVLDGGNNGPNFSVRRIPCSTFPLPNASTVLFPNNAKVSDSSTDKTDSAVSCITTAPDGEDDIMALLEEPCQLDEDLVTCMQGSLGNKQEGSGLQLDLFSSRTEKEASRVDRIGEFVVQGESLTFVWSKVVSTILDACCEQYRQSGSVEFCCNHVSDGVKNPGNLGNLARVCCASGRLDMPRTIQNEKNLESSCLAIREWLDGDRAGLDFEFVQEIIENLLPACGNCTRYHFLGNRSNFLEGFTVASENLVALPRHGGGKRMVEALYGLRKLQRDDKPPGGKPLSERLPAKLAGDVFQIWEFMYRFKDILDLQGLPTYEDIEEELINPWPETPRGTRDQFEGAHSGGHDHSSQPSSNGKGVSMFVPVESSSTREASQVKLASGSLGQCGGIWLATIHSSLLKLLLNEVISRAVVFVDPTAEARESRPRRGRRKDSENSATKDPKVDILTLNELTWPELARRYALAVEKLGACVDLSDMSCSDGVKIFRTLQGDGGVLFGAISGVTGIKADASLLAEAQRQIFDPANDKKVILMESKDNSDVVASPEPATADVNIVPEWAQPLENVRKLPTNVGTRIRKCIFEVLERNPPDWAKKILEHSISKEVYKGNASGPTKKLALSVLADASGGPVPQKPPEKKPQKESRTVSMAESITKKCRIVLRQTLTTITEKQKNFCNLLGASLVNSDEEEFEGIIGFPSMFSRPLDFRTIDMRLAAGAYGGSHEAFLEDVREVLQNLRTGHADDSSQLEKVEKLSDSFESVYKTEVLSLVEKFAAHPISPNHNKNLGNELLEALAVLNELPKAPWDDGLCKVCGVDRDDKSVLLCDTCDSEYHMYCLTPPLTRIPEGNWYCPYCCMSKGKGTGKERQDNGTAEKRRLNRYIGEEKGYFKFALSQLVSTMEQREYWEMSVDERIFLLKFLCEELLNSSLLRDHIDQCIEKSIDLQQKLKSASSELRTLKVREDILAIKALKSDSRPNNESNNEECTTSICVGDANQCGNETEEGPTNGDPIDKSVMDNEMDTVKTEILTLQDAILKLELQLSRVCLRREFLGRDTLGRLYWITTRPGKRPWLVIDGTAPLQKERSNVKSTFSNQSVLLGQSEAIAEVAPLFVLYESEEEVHALLNWLGDSDPRERELKESILTLQRLVFNQDSSSDNPFLPHREILSPQLKTRALGVLESQFGSISDDEIKELPKRPKKKGKMIEEKMYRCECLEPVWTSRNHCFSCHNTFLVQTELDAHIRKCTPQLNTKSGIDVVNENAKEKDDRTDANMTLKCPFDFEEICKRFIVKDSLKEDVQQIGLIGSNGVPSFVNKRASYLDPDNLVLLHRTEDLVSGGITEAGSHSGHGSHLTPTEEQSVGKRESSSDNEKVMGLAANSRCTVPEASLRPVKGRNSQVLRFLKTNLLDMEAALPDEALRLTRYDSAKRRAWRAFVKTAESIYEMVQAIILLEGMVKSEYIKPQWWHWSSLTAAARTPSITCLALRLCTLDDCLVYSKDASSGPAAEPADSAPTAVKSSSKGKKRKDSD